LSQLKRSGLGPNELVQFYRTCIRPITEYACPVFNESLPAYLSRELEAVQKRAMRIIFPFFTYEEALDKASLVTLSGRRQALTDKLFNNILENNDSRLRNLLPHGILVVITSESHASLTLFLRLIDLEIVLLSLMYLSLDFNHSCIVL
ncbi:hypothetical protein ACROYT_G026007, partial [Oculina patagonica]